MYAVKSCNFWFYGSQRVKHIPYIYVVMYVFMYPQNLFLTKHAVHIHVLQVGSMQQEHKLRERTKAMLRDMYYVYKNDRIVILCP